MVSVQVRAPDPSLRSRMTLRVGHFVRIYQCHKKFCVTFSKVTACAARARNGVSLLLSFSLCAYSAKEKSE